MNIYISQTTIRLSNFVSIFMPIILLSAKVWNDVIYKLRQLQSQPILNMLDDQDNPCLQNCDLQDNCTRTVSKLSLQCEAYFKDNLVDYCAATDFVPQCDAYAAAYQESYQTANNVINGMLLAQAGISIIILFPLALIHRNYCKSIKEYQDLESAERINLIEYYALQGKKPTTLLYSCQYGINIQYETFRHSCLPTILNLESKARGSANLADILARLNDNTAILKESEGIPALKKLSPEIIQRILIFSGHIHNDQDLNMLNKLNMLTANERARNNM